jgi:hypothetical protein
MSDYRTMFDNDYLGSWDLDSRDVTVTIARVVAKTIQGDGGKSDRKPVVYFKRADGTESPKGLVLNKTNGRTVASLYGPKVEAWAGKRITLYPTTTTVGRETRECIRVRPVVPTERAAGGSDVEAP